MPETFQHTTRVEFRDTDAAGIVHFSVYFTYMEEAEHSLIKHLGLAVMMEDEQGAFSWPRVAARCDYSAPLRFGEEVVIATTIGKLGERSITYHHEFLLNGKSVGSGEITTVCCGMGEDGSIRSRPIPDFVREKLQPYADQP